MSEWNETCKAPSNKPEKQVGQHPCNPEHRRFNYVPPVNPELEKVLKSLEEQPKGVYGTQAPAFDKNTPSSLKILRWSIYEVIDNYQGDYSKTIAGWLKQEVERLFKEYTNS